MITKAIVFTCDQCGHRWLPRIPAPLQCPSCKSRVWNSMSGQSGWVYLAGCDGKPLVKVGYTLSPNVKSRLNSIHYPMSSEPLTLAAVVPACDAKLLEASLHQRFTQEGKHSAGEWYTLTADDIVWVVSGEWSVNASLISEDSVDGDGVPTEPTLDTSDSQDDQPRAGADRGYHALFRRRFGRNPKDQTELDTFKAQRLAAQ